MEEPSTSQLTPLQIWLLASRPRTLPAAAATVIAGSGAALAEGKFKPLVFLAALAAALLLQIGANLANDVFDFLRGADASQRLGPTRVTQSGLLTPRQVLRGMWVVFGLAALLGLYLTIAAGWPVIAIGLACILASVAYSGGPFPFGYYGFGDLVVFLFFGPLAVCGTYYVHASTVTPLAIWSSLPIGLLITAILVVNNLRDVGSDSLAGKKTLAVRLGERGARWEYTLCLIGAYLSPLLMWLAGAAPAWVFLTWLSFPRAVSAMRFIWKQTGRALNQGLADTGSLTLLYSLLFAFGLALPALLPLIER
jgi:1,4-dihydroxy-2-naphthoate octaprenyltransferase